MLIPYGIAGQRVIAELDNATAEKALIARGLGKNVRDMSGDSRFRYETVCSDIDDTCGRWFACMIASKVPTIVRMERIGRDPADISRILYRKIEATPIMFGYIDVDRFFSCQRHGNRDVDYPRWYPLGDTLRVKLIRPANRIPIPVYERDENGFHVKYYLRNNPGRIVSKRREHRRYTFAWIDNESGMAFETRMIGWNPSKGGGDIHAASLVGNDLLQALSTHRANGHRANGLRYAADALVFATFDGNELACAILDAVRMAGTWAILMPKPLAKVSPNKRDMVPCKGLAEWIAEPFKQFARVAPQSLIVETVKPYLRDYDTDDVECHKGKAIEPMVADSFNPAARDTGPAKDCHRTPELYPDRYDIQKADAEWFKRRDAIRRRKGLSRMEAWPKLA